MMQVLTGLELQDRPRLARSMHLDRACQFRDRLGWDVTITDDGEERDEYDREDTTYVILVDQDGLHAGSMRLLPTTGPTMISEHFRDLVANIDFVSPAIWECTRFCISEGQAAGAIARALFQSGADIMRKNELLGFVGVFDPIMERVYRRHGASPEVLGETTGVGGQKIKFGYWRNCSEARRKLCSMPPLEKQQKVEILAWH